MAHDGKPGKDEEVDWGKRRNEQSRLRFSASEWFRHYYIDAIDGADAVEVKERVHRHGLMAYLNVFEERCQRSALDMIQEAHHWIILPPHSRTAAFATWACIMFSNICSLCHDLMVHHRSYPWKMFGLLVDSSSEQEIMLDCKHMMDPWSRELVAKCHCKGWGSMTPLSFLSSRQLSGKFAV